MHLEVVGLFAVLSLGAVSEPGEDIEPRKGVLRPCGEELWLQ